MNQSDIQILLLGYEKALGLEGKNLRYNLLDPRFLNNDHLHYQRFRIEEKIQHYIKHWDDLKDKKDDKLNRIAALRNDGTFWVINGQHHAEAAVRMGDNSLGFFVFDSPGWEFEKEVFTAFQKLQDNDSSSNR